MASLWGPLWPALGGHWPLRDLGTGPPGTPLVQPRKRQKHGRCPPFCSPVRRAAPWTAVPFGNPDLKSGWTDCPSKQRPPPTLSEGPSLRRTDREAGAASPSGCRRGRLQGLRLRQEWRGQDCSGGQAGRPGGASGAPRDDGRSGCFPGIQTTTLYWPAKLRASGRALFFKLSFWDCGEAALKKFDHLLPACREKADAFLFLFSFADRASFDDLPNQISRVANGARNILRIVVGTKYDQFAHADVTESDLVAFCHTWGLPVLRAKSVSKRTPNGYAGLAEVAHLLNRLAEHLWRQDQVVAGLIPPVASSTLPEDLAP